MNTEELLSNQKELNNVKDILRDTLNADPVALSKLDSMHLDLNAIKTALQFLKNNPNISDKEKAELTTNSWRVTYRDRPPSPAEFITEKYLGPVAKTTYPRIKNTFIEFLDPTKPYRDLFLYSAIGYGKSYCSTLITLYIATHLSLMRDPWKFFGLAQPLNAKVYIDKNNFTTIGEIKVGDKILSPSGKQQVIEEIKDWKNDRIYEIELEDGSKVQAGENHLWKVYINNEPQIVNTKYLIENYLSMDIEIEKLAE